MNTLLIRVHDRRLIWRPKFSVLWDIDSENNVYTFKPALETSSSFLRVENV